MRKEQKKQIINSITVVVGTFILAIAVETFIIPYRILSGGVAGIAVALHPILHISATLIANSVLIILLIIGSFILGKEFLKNTVLSCIAYPIFTSILNGRVNVVVDPILASLYGGLIAGAGVGIVLKTGASTGGMDIPPLIINKLTGIKLSTLVLITDFLTVLLGLFVYDLSAVLLGLVSVFASSAAISKVLTINGTVSKAVQIISVKYEDILKEIDAQLERGATLLQGYGSYTGEEKRIILCVVSDRQYGTLIEIVKEIDPSAFIITTDATDMHGEGFTYGFRI
ncbi:MAG: YitT family protein [Bulleidia sp.]|nr:YitT family protein [Erysipelotrichaceae bacterium]MDY2781415.1 YitT family protein [Bulleidia sp.]